MLAIPTMDETAVEVPGAVPSHASRCNPRASIPQRATTFVHLLESARITTVDGELQPQGAPAKLLAYIALSRPQAVDRHRLAGTLWPETTEERAQSNLRTALWRLRNMAPSALVVDGNSLRLDPGVELDIERPFFGRPNQKPSQALPRTLPTLLPGWSDEWVTFDRERLRLTMLRELEDRCRSYLDRGEFGDAIALSMLGISAEPMRETCYALVIEAHLKRGNYTEAVKVLDRLEELLLIELGVRPSGQLYQLLEDAVSTRREGTGGV